MSLTPSGVVVGLLHLALTGVDARGFSHAWGIPVWSVACSPEFGVFPPVARERESTSASFARCSSLIAFFGTIRIQAKGSRATIEPSGLVILISTSSGYLAFRRFTIAMLHVSAAVMVKNASPRTWSVQVSNSGIADTSLRLHRSGGRCWYG